MRHRQSGLAGPLAALQERAPRLARAYALLLLPVALLGMGNLAQVQVLSEALARGAHLPRLAVAAGVLAVLLPLVRGGIGRIMEMPPSNCCSVILSSTSNARLRHQGRSSL